MHPTICYNGICGELSYRYWNNDFFATEYQSNTLPTENYGTRELLVENYGSSNFVNRPYYIRTILIDGVPVGHQACLWNETTNKEFCFRDMYWGGLLNTESSAAGTQTRIKLQRDMQNALGVTIQNSSCSSNNTNTYCFIGALDCSSHYSGYVGCGLNNDSRCYVNGSGDAVCIAW